MGMFSRNSYLHEGRPSMVFINGRYKTIMPTGALQGPTSLSPWLLTLK
jgi:hypothetical protein